MSGPWPGIPKPQEMPLLKEPAKKFEFEGQVDPVESEVSKGKQKQTHEQDQETTKPSDQAANTKSKTRKKDARHAARVESLLQQFQEEMSEPEEDEEEDDPINSDVEGAERLPKKRSFQQSAISDSDHSDYGAGRSGRVEGDRKNIPYTGGQPSAQATSGGPRESPARKSHSRSPTKAPEAGNKEIPKTSVEYLINKK